MEWTIVEFAEPLVLPGVVRGYVVGEPEKEMMKGFSRDKVEVGLLDAAGMWPDSDLLAGNSRNSFHLFEPVRDGGVEFVFV
jgi:hypothetical protein